MALFNLASRVDVVSCRGTGESTCVLTMIVNVASLADDSGADVRNLEVA